MVSITGAKRKLSGYYQKCIDGMINGNISMATRASVQKRLDDDLIDDYCKECGVTDPALIDWDNPVVAVAHLLHDPLYRHYIIRGNAKQKQQVYDLMTPEMLDVYYNYVGDYGGKFCDLEDKHARKQDKKDYKKRMKCNDKYV